VIEVSSETPSFEGINQFLNEKDYKEIKKPVTPSLCHRSSTGSLKKAKLLGVIGTNDDSLKFLGKENEFVIGGTVPIENKSIHLCYELGSGNVNKMPSIIEDRTEEGSDTEDMKLLIKKEQGKKKGDKLSKLHIGKLGADLITEDSKKADGYTSMPYSPFSTNFELFKNNVIESLPVRSGLGSHRNSISCTYDILTNLSNYSNVRRGSLPALNYSYHSAINHSAAKELVTPPHSAGVSSSSSVSNSATNSSASSSLSSPSSNSTMVNQSGSNADLHSYSFNKMNFNNNNTNDNNTNTTTNNNSSGKSQKAATVQLSSSSTPSTKASESIKGKKKKKNFF